MSTNINTWKEEGGRAGSEGGFQNKKENIRWEFHSNEI